MSNTLQISFPEPQTFVKHDKPNLPEPQTLVKHDRSSLSPLPLPLPHAREGLALADPLSLIEPLDIVPPRASPTRKTRTHEPPRVSDPRKTRQIELPLPLPPPSHAREGVWGPADGINGDPPPPRFNSSTAA